jgi:hypothetical protein
MQRRSDVHVTGADGVPLRASVRTRAVRELK